MAFDYKSDGGYNYEEDYFLNGDSKFDSMFDDLKGMYQTYIHTDDFGRQQIDTALHTGPDGMRGFIRDSMDGFGIENLDQRLAVFNDKDHPFTARDLEQQDQLRQEIYDAYVGFSDEEKMRCVSGIRNIREQVDAVEASVSATYDTVPLPGFNVSESTMSSTLETSDSLAKSVEQRYDGLRPILERQRAEEQSSVQVTGGEFGDFASQQEHYRARQENFIAQHPEGRAGRTENRLEKQSQFSGAATINEYGEIVRPEGALAQGIGGDTTVRENIRGIADPNAKGIPGQAAPFPRAEHLPYTGKEAPKPKILPNFDGKAPEIHHLPWTTNDKQIDSGVKESSKGKSKSLADVIKDLGEHLQGSPKDAVQVDKVNPNITREQRVQQAENLVSNVVRKDARESSLDITD